MMIEQGSAPAGSGAARVVQLLHGAILLPAVSVVLLLLEGSGVVGAAGYLLTGSAALAVTAAVAIVALFSVRPAPLEA